MGYLLQYLCNSICLTMSKSVIKTRVSLFTHLFTTKSSISLVFFVYCVSILSQLILVLTTSQANAETSKPLSRLIAVLVDQPLYDEFATPINRYASKYLQAQYSDSKAIIIPIKSENFQAQDIHKMLQNLYFEGQQDTPSELIGVTLIGDIALPVVNDSGYYYPTIYPYIDFLDPQFVFSEQDNIFISNSA